MGWLNGTGAARTVMALFSLAWVPVAAGDPRVALVPVFVSGESAEHSYLREALDEETAGLPLVGSAEVDAALKEAANPACHDQPSCIAGLSRRSGATHVLVVAIVAFRPETINLSGRLYDASGSLLGSSALSYPKDSTEARRETARLQFRALLDQLPLDKVRPMVPAANAGTQPPASQPAPNVLRIGTYVLIGGAGVAGVGAAVVGIAARSDRERLAAMVDHQGVLKAGASQEETQRLQEEARQLQDSLRARERLAAGLLIAAGVAAAASVPLFLVSEPRAEVRVGAVPVVTPAGAALAFSGTF